MPAISSGYGPRDGGWHAGIDLPARPGTPVQAVASGLIVRASVHPVFGRVVLQRIGAGRRRGLGTYAVYAHLRTLAVVRGDRVAAGALLGTVGNTGRTTGPHLHFSLMKNVPDAKVRSRGPIGVRERNYAVDPEGVAGCVPMP